MCNVGGGCVICHMHTNTHFDGADAAACSWSSAKVLSGRKTLVVGSTGEKLDSGGLGSRDRGSTLEWMCPGRWIISSFGE